MFEFLLCPLFPLTDDLWDTSYWNHRDGRGVGDPVANATSQQLPVDDSLHRIWSIPPWPTPNHNLPLYECLLISWIASLWPWELHDFFRVPIYFDRRERGRDEWVREEEEELVSQREADPSINPMEEREREREYLDGEEEFFQWLGVLTQVFSLCINACVSFLRMWWHHIFPISKLVGIRFSRFLSSHSFPFVLPTCHPQSFLSIHFKVFSIRIPFVYLRISFFTIFIIVSSLLIGEKFWEMWNFEECGKLA